MSRLSINAWVVLVSLVTIISLGLGVVPYQAHAQAVQNTNQISDVAPLSFLDEFKNAVTSVFSGTTAESTAWTALKGQVLDPLAHALAQAVLKQITASIVNAINGTNGSPQFVTNLAGNLQATGDQVGLSFIAQFTKQSNSPFAPAIGSAVQQNYTQQTSLAGFFAANQCTLTQSSPNINSFVAGNFSQGSWGTWLSLTGTSPNNPYVLYANTKSQAASVVGAAQTNQRQTISQNNGFLSSCPSGSTSASSITGTACTFSPTGNSCAGAEVCTPGPGQTGASGTGTCAQPTAATSDQTAATCYDDNGNPVPVQTPGSVIESTLNKSLGSGIDSLVSVHDFDQMVDTILSALATKVVSTGLAALSGSSASSPSVTSQLASGSTATDPNAASVASQATTLAQNTMTQLTTYTAAWQTIQTAAQTASSSIGTLMAACSSLANAGQTALLTEVQPVLNNAQAAFASASTTQALAVQVESDATAYTAGSAGAEGALTADTQSLSVAPPSGSDVANAQSQAAVQNGATSSSPYVLTVSGGTTVDQMNLISTNAQNALPACGPPLLPL
jgi:hypothetical protein